MGLFFDNSAYPHIRPVLCDVQVAEVACVVDEHGGACERSIFTALVEINISILRHFPDVVLGNVVEGLGIVQWRGLLYNNVVP